MSRMTILSLWFGCTPGVAKLDTEPSTEAPVDGTVPDTTDSTPDSETDADTDSDTDADVDADVDTDTATEPTATTDTAVPTSTVDTGTTGGTTTVPAVSPYDGPFAGPLTMECSSTFGILTVTCVGDLEAEFVTASSPQLVGSGSCVFDGVLLLLGSQLVTFEGDLGYPEPDLLGQIQVSFLDTSWEGTFLEPTPDVFQRLAGSFTGTLTVLDLIETDLDCTGLFDLDRQ